MAMTRLKRTEPDIARIERIAYDFNILISCTYRLEFHGSKTHQMAFRVQ